MKKRLIKMRIYKIMYRLKVISTEQYFNMLVETHEQLKKEMKRK